MMQLARALRGDATMGHPLRWFLPGVVYETTIRTVQGRFLLRPTDRSREVILGVLGRAQLLYPEVRLYGFVYLSNHAHLLVSCDYGERLAAFLGFVNGNVAREMGRMHAWSGPLWGRRHRPIPILDENALVARLRYVIAQGVKEGLVRSPRDWPGASCVPALLGSMVVEGIWYDRDRETRARRRGLVSGAEAFAHRYSVALSPIPPWEDLSPAELAKRHAQIVREIETEAATTRAGVVGVAALQRQNPHARPVLPKEAPAPRCHSSSSRLKVKFLAALRRFVDGFRAAASTLRATGQLNSGFPPGSFPPALAYVAFPESAGPIWSPLDAS